MTLNCNALFLRSVQRCIKDKSIQNEARCVGLLPDLGLNCPSHVKSLKNPDALAQAPNLKVGHRHESLEGREQPSSLRLNPTC